jgi:RNA-binding protein PNO1
MAHKSHRQKALQAQLEAPHEISLVKPKKVKAPKVAASEGMDVDGDDVLISSGAAASSSTVPDASASSSGFAPLPASAQNAVLKGEFRRVPIPPHRMTPLKREWVNLYTPLVEMLGLQVRMNVKRRAVEIKVGWESAFGEKNKADLTELRSHRRLWCRPEGRRLRQGLCSWLRDQRK